MSEQITIAPSYFFLLWLSTEAAASDFETVPLGPVAVVAVGDLLSDTPCIPAFAFVTYLHAILSALAACSSESLEEKESMHATADASFPLQQRESVNATAAAVADPTFAPALALAAAAPASADAPTTLVVAAVAPAATFHSAAAFAAVPVAPTAIAHSAALLAAASSAAVAHSSVAEGVAASSSAADPAAAWKADDGDLPIVFADSSAEAATAAGSLVDILVAAVLFAAGGDLLAIVDGSPSLSAVIEAD